MSILLKIACQVIARRRASGELFEDIIKDYPRMTTDQVTEIREELSIDD
ncbi:antitoxin [Faecalispora jeddahensis]|nr:antitoxin [Faecalispora jeddahensis]